MSCFSDYLLTSVNNMINVKIDTKEKFQVITPHETSLSVNMTDELSQLLLSCLKKEPRNVVLNLEKAEAIDDGLSQTLVDLQQQFYDEQVSFVICGLQEPVEQKLDELELLEMMNVTPTESEAWDIVQMEEIEREMLGDDE